MSGDRCAACGQPGAAGARAWWLSPSTLAGLIAGFGGLVAGFGLRGRTSDGSPAALWADPRVLRAWAVKQLVGVVASIVVTGAERAPGPPPEPASELRCGSAHDGGPSAGRRRAAVSGWAILGSNQ